MNNNWDLLKQIEASGSKDHTEAEIQRIYKAAMSESKNHIFNSLHDKIKPHQPMELKPLNFPQRSYHIGKSIIAATIVPLMIFLTCAGLLFVTAFLITEGFK